MLDTKYLYLLEPSCQSLFLKKRRGGGGIYVYVCAFIQIYATYVWLASGVRYPRAGVTGGCEPPSMASGNKT